MKKKLYILFTIIILCISSNIKAQDISAANSVGDIIYYNITSNVAPYTVAVTYKGSSHMAYPNEYMGAIQIPSTVINNGITYSVTSIGEYAFGLCSALTSVNLPNSITSISQQAFFECEALTSINLHNFITSIGDFSFFGCIQLTSVNIPNTLISISNGVFKNTGLTSVTIPNSVRQIGAGAFWNCSGLISVNITDSLTSIGNYAFSGCSSLSSSILLPNSLTKIENNTFEYCSNLTSVVIGKNITSIGAYAFRNCSNLNSIIFPYNLDSIGYRAFINCIGLTSITFKEVTPPTFDQFDIFNNVPNTTQINVPCGSKALYQSRLWNRNIQDSIDCNFLSVNISNISATHARININTATTDITTIGFQWKVNGDSLFTTHIDSNANLQYTITGLSASTKYNYRIFYVINNEPYYTIIDTFLTHCNSINLPFYEDFETALSCWLSFKTTNYSLMVVSSGADPNCSPYSGVNMVKYDSWYIEAGNYAGYITPPINLLTNSQLSIWIYRNNGNYSNNNEGLRFYVNSENTLDGANELGFISNNILAPPTISTDGWYNYTLTIPSSEIGEKYIILKAESQRGYNIYFDDLRIVPPSQTVFTSPTTNISSSSATLNGYYIASINPIISKGFQYKRSIDTIWNIQPVQLDSTIFFYFIAGLIQNTEYNVRAYTISSIDTIFGSTENFATLSAGDSIIEASICQGQTYTLNGFNRSEAGTYVRNLQTTSGSDSTITLILSVNPIASTNLSASICQGETYLLNGFNTDTSGIYIHNLQTINGCDSTVTLNLIVNPTYNTQIFDSIFLRGRYTLNGFNEREEGIYTKNLQSINGCDSIVTLNLKKILPTSIIDGDTIYYKITSYIPPFTAAVTFRGNTYQQYENEYRDTITIPSTITYHDTIYNVTAIGERAFYQCNELVSINIPNTVTSIDNEAFEFCNSLTSILMSDSLTFIDRDAFANCTNLTSINLPNSVTFISDFAFYNCTNLMYVNLGNSLDSLGYNVFERCISLSSIVIPNSVTFMANSVFSNCSGLTSIVLSNSLQRIGSNCFYYCSNLSSITIPPSINYIGIGAFYKCTGLTSISCLPLIPPIADHYNSFTDVQNSIPVIVPCGSLSQYQNSTYWSYFTNIQQVQIDTTYFNASICQGETYLLNGFNADSAGTYIQNLESINGCDSIVTLTLNVNELMIPTNLALDNIANYIELTWRGNGENYIVYRNNDSIANITDTIYQDTNVIDGTNYCYKIKALNSNCESEVCQEVCKVFSGLNHIENNDLSVILYPNPTNDKAILEVEGLTKEADVIVYDINGRKLKQYNLNAGQKELEIDVTGLAKGVYNVKIVNDNISLTRKLIVR